MHDPLTVAFELRRPWPQRSDVPVQTNRRWQIRLHHDRGEWCEKDGPDACGYPKNPFPWWRLRSYSAFWIIAGRQLYWPAMITVWHREPGGRDSGEVCKHWHRWQNEAGEWRSKKLNGWRWHAHHWKIQIRPLQHLRRWALTRCEWCGGRSGKSDYVNFASSWSPSRARWWQGERELYHEDCHAVSHAHGKCYCDSPLLDKGDYGTCAFCGKFRAWRQVPDDADWLLRKLPTGSRIPSELRPALEAAWGMRREAASPCS